MSLLVSPEKEMGKSKKTDETLPKRVFVSFYLLFAELQWCVCCVCVVCVCVCVS
jgi:hypothetical protein